MIFSNSSLASFFLGFQLWEVPFSECAENIVLIFHSMIYVIVGCTYWFR
jgi:hypothetical protein